MAGIWGWLLEGSRAGLVLTWEGIMPRVIPRDPQRNYKVSCDLVLEVSTYCFCHTILVNQIRKASPGQKGGGLAPPLDVKCCLQTEREGRDWEQPSLQIIRYTHTSCKNTWDKTRPVRGFFFFFKITFYWLCYYSGPDFPPLLSSTWHSPYPQAIPPPLFMSMGHAYKFFGYSISCTVLYIPMAILWLSICTSFF